MITIQNLTKTYHTKSGEVEALRGISAEIRDGDIFGIIGLSGAGKSTLLRCIALLETPTSGSISIDGRDLSSLRGRQLTEHRRQIGVIFQGYNLLMQRTVSGNIAFPLEIAGVPKAEIRRRTEELIHLVGLDGKADAYPSQLSGGQCQRVAIARALANNPKVLLCDEPTSALDSFTTKAILDLLSDINQKLGVTIIIITHEIGVVKQICSQVAVIESGRFAEYGVAAEVLAAPWSWRCIVMNELIARYAPLLLQGLEETLYMTVFSTVLAYVFGLPLGVLVYVTKDGGIHPNRPLNRVLSWFINLIRSVPFLILIVALNPISKLIAGTSIGPKSSIFALVVAAAPFVARMVESSLEELDTGVIEAAKTMGASDLQIITKVLLPESVPSLVRGLSISAITLIGYSAMAGVVGAGGLGDIAIRYGVHRYEDSVMYITVILIVVVVQVIQSTFNLTAIQIDKRNR